MFFWQYDIESGGLLLNPNLKETKCLTLHETRPVWANELNRKGYDKVFDYDKNAENPICWREASYLYYRGRRIGKIAAPRTGLETVDHFTKYDNAPRELVEVDLQTQAQANEFALNKMLETTSQRLLDTLKQEGFDKVSVSYSGGKDSDALLEVVLKTLPPEKIIVLFGNTGMEFPTTYKHVKDKFAYLTSLGIECHECSCPLPVEDTWRLFGAPSRTRRWCCSVHKACQNQRWILQHKEKLLTLVGVRASESLKRSKYDFIDRGTKSFGSISFYPILDLSSAEIWTLLLSKPVNFNEAYKLGLRRVGCLICPMGGVTVDLESIQLFPNEANKFISLINANEEGFTQAFENGMWRARRGARNMSMENKFARDKYKNGMLLVSKTPRDKVESWLKVFSKTSFQNDSVIAEFQGCSFESKVYYKDNHFCLFTPNLTGSKKYESVLYKILSRAAYCVGCGVCESQCVRGAIIIDRNGYATIDESSCVHCYHCIDKYCLRFESLYLPKEQRKDLLQLGIDLVENKTNE